LDINDFDSNSGDNNTCGTAGGWNDTGDLGCRYLCLVCIDNDDDGYGVCPACNASYNCMYDGNDCDDDNNSINPGIIEICNGEDDDCDSKTDEENAIGCINYYADIDGDGYGDLMDSKCICAPENPYNTTKNTDCNDNNNSINPGANDIPDNNIDENCNNYDNITCHEDSDSDGYGNATETRTSDTGTCPEGYVIDSTDCDDNNNSIVPAEDNLNANRSLTLCKNFYNIPDSGDYGVIIINSSDIILDCNNATLNGTGSGAGIYVENKNNVTIKNCRILNYDTGIYLYYSSNNNIENNTANSNDWGIYLSRSSNNILQENKISNNNIGILSDDSDTIINSNFVCNNTDSDFDSFDWLSSSGDNNTCDNADGWDDSNKIGCANLCLQSPSISGYVFDSETFNPILDARVNLYENGINLVASFNTTLDGYYVFTNPSSGIYTINVSSEGYANISTSLFEFDGISQWEINFSLAQYTIEGYVFDISTNNPIPETEVTLYFDNGTQQIAATNMTDSDGYYKFHPLKEGNYSLNSTKEDYLTCGEYPVELSETNYLWKVNFSINKIPDFAVSTIDYSPANPQAGEVLTITSNIKNLGSISNDICTMSGMSNSFVGAKINSKSPDMSNINVSINISDIFTDWQPVNLTNRTEINVTFNWSAVAGAHNVSVVVDPLNLINESDEGNNLRWVVVNVTTLQGSCYTNTAGICTINTGENCTCINQALNETNCNEVQMQSDIINWSGTCVDWPADGKVLDCRGFMIDGDDMGNDYGIFAGWLTENLIIKRCNISGYGTGLSTHSKNISIINNTIQNNLYGIDLYYAINAKLQNNRFYINDYNNLDVGGFLPEHYDHNIDTTNLINDEPIFYFFNFTDIVFNDLSGSLLYLSFSNNIKITNNSIHNGDGIILAFTSNSLIYSNNLTNNHVGIQIEIQKSNYGLSDNNVVKNNNLMGNYVGLEITTSNNNTLIEK